MTFEKLYDKARRLLQLEIRMLKLNSAACQNPFMTETYADAYDRALEERARIYDELKEQGCETVTEVFGVGNKEITVRIYNNHDINIEKTESVWV